MWICNMAQDDPHNNRPKADSDERSSVSVEAWLEVVSKELDSTECPGLFELGIYSIHDHSSARTVTLPKGAEAFHDAAAVRQFYFEAEDCPLLIAVPLTV